MEETISKQAVRGAASGIFFMTFFGVVWAITGITGLQELGSVSLLIPVIIIGILLFICATSLQRAAGKLPSHSVAAGRSHVDKWFGIIFLLEFALIGVAGAICGMTGHFDWFAPVTALIVGVHFFPLAYLFRVNTHYIAGSLLCLLSIVTMLFVPVKIAVGTQEIIAWWTIVGFGSALILWATGAAIWLSTRKLLKRPLSDASIRG